MAEGHVQVGLDFVAEDHASGTLHKLMEGAEKLNEKFEHVTESLVELLGVGAALGGVFSFAKMVEGTEERITAVDKLSRQTGLAAEETDGLLESMNRFGISSEEATGIVGRLSKQMLKTSEAAGLGNLKQSAQSMRRLGVDINQGVVPSLIAMAKQTEKGKLNVAAIQVGMRTSTESALKLNKYFGQGAEKLKETIEEVKNSGLAVRERDIAMLDRFKVAKNDVTAAVERIGLVFGREVLPVMTDLMEQLANKMKEWAPAVKEFGHWLGANLREGIQLATTLGKILLANYALQKAGMGGIGGALQGAAGLAKTAASNFGPGLSTSKSMIMEGGNAIWKGMGIVKLTAELTALALAAEILIGGIIGVIENFHGVRDFILEGLDDVMSALTNLIPTSFLNGLSEMSSIFKEALPLAINTILEVVRLIIESVHTLFRFLGSGNVLSTFFSGGGMDFIGTAKALGKTFAEIHKENNKTTSDKAAARFADRAAAHAGDKAPVHNMNFPGARFDITQTFAEGFEPDRILTAFTHDLAGLGTRGIQSPYAPLGTVGGAGGG